MPEYRPQEGPQTDFLASTADIALFGGSAGSGKSYIMLIDPIRHIENPLFGGVIFRRTMPQITSEGSLWDTAEQIYSDFGATPRIQPREWIFPTGAKMKFASMEHEKSKKEWQGSQIAFIGFDELTHFTQSQFMYMLSRNRSMSGVRPYIRATCNPDSNSWVRQLVDWWIGPDGYAIPERSGLIRYFVNLEGKFHWADTPEELKQRFGPKVRPKSFTFVSALLSDNKILMDTDPDYIANLMALPLIEREQLLHGNWNISAEGGIIRADWIQYYTQLPPESEIKCYTWAWDTAVKEGQNNDYSVGQLWAEANNGHYLVSQFRDKLAYPLLKKKVRELAGIFPAREILIEDKQSGQQLIQDFAADSLLPVIAMMPGRNMGLTKEERANYVSTMFEAGKVFIPSGLAWTTELVQEWCAFPNSAHDDQMDTTSMYLSRKMRERARGIIPIVLPYSSGGTMADYESYEHHNSFEDRFR